MWRDDPSINKAIKRLGCMCVQGGFVKIWKKKGGGRQYGRVPSANYETGILARNKSSITGSGKSSKSYHKFSPYL